MSPPPKIVRIACEFASKSPCAHSRRGVVVFGREPAGDLGHGIAANAITIYGTGFNGPPRPFKCDGSRACQRDCGVLCMHAEMRALLCLRRSKDGFESSILMGEPAIPEHTKLELVHVKVDAAGQLVPGKGPCCELCSRMILDVGIEMVWLYEIEAPDEPPPPGMVLATGVWRPYTAAEFHRITLEALGFHVSKEDNVHPFSRQYQSPSCAACGEDESHKVHVL